MCDDITLREKLCDLLIADYARGAKAIETLLRPGSLVALIAVALYGAGQIMEARDFPKATTWETDAPASTALVVVGVVATLSTLLVIIGYRQALKREREQKKLSAVCRDVWRIVHNATGIPSDFLGVHAWVITGFPGGRHLVARTKFMPIERPSAPVKWRRGKGAIGKCWDLEREFLADLEPLHALGPNEQQFCELGRDERIGLCWQDYQRTKEYRAIWVRPILKGPQANRKVAGCVSVDVVDYDSAAEKLENTMTTNRDLLPVWAFCDSVLD
jgi:hypothetical protein